MEGTCSKCDREGVIRRGLCNSHYQEARKLGWPEGKPDRVPVSKETAAKISAGLRGNTNCAGRQNALGKSWTLTDEQREARRGPRPFMYADDPGYMAVHNWVRRHHVKTGTCEACGDVPDNGGHGTNWANISGEYRREREDFWELCIPCHRMFDWILRIEQADPELIAVLRAKRST